MINLQLIIILIFLGTLGLAFSGLYFFVASPLARHKLKMRLTSASAAAIDADGEGEESEMMSDSA